MSAHFGPAPAGTSTARLSLAVFKFSSCDGCQLSLLDCEEELLAVAEAVDIAYFPEATSAVVEGPYDLALIEGSVATGHDVERIREIRRQSRRLITIGACATSGGIQALRNVLDFGALVGTVYAHPEYIDALATSTPIAQHVPVDGELRGCPIDKAQLLELISAVIAGRAPVLPTTSVCVECKLRGTTCLLVGAGIPCLGPVTQAGCHALCPSFDRGCFGCFGPDDTPNTVALADRFVRLGLPRRRIEQLFRGINGNTAVFAKEAARHV